LFFSFIFSPVCGDFVDETPFECGLNYNLGFNLPFSFQFFLISVLFLVFDIEISLVVPFSVEEWSLFNSNNVFVILFVLLVGVVYEWKNGKISWSV